jgi:antitoxin (DNA-binding transcriptional repressor) of toxin-antitoxin stability system
MKTVTIRDLRTRPREVQQSLSAGDHTLLTSNGKPVAIMVPVDSSNFDETLELLQRARAQQAVRAIRRSAQAAGTDNLSPKDIDRVVAETRKKRRERRG